MKISIIMATFNVKETISRALESINYQTYKDIEVLISDGGSTDGTAEIIENFHSSGRLVWWTSEKDRGIYDAWNKAIEQSVGDWIMFLGADDLLFSPTCIQDAVDQLRLVSDDVLLAQAPVMAINKDGSKAVVSSPHKLKPANFGPFRLLTSDLAWYHPGTFHRRKLFDFYGKFDSTYRIAGDFEFTLRYAKRTENEIAVLNCGPVNRFTLEGCSSSFSNRKKAADERLRAVRYHMKGQVPYNELWTYCKSVAVFLLYKCLGEFAVRYLADGYRLLTRRKSVYVGSQN